MVEEAKGEERKTQDEIKPSDLRPQAQFYELVRARNPKTSKESDFLYWWNKDKKEIIIEEVDAGGMRVEDTPVVQRPADSPKEARKKITKDINTQRKKGLKIGRHQSLDRKLFDKGRVMQGVRIPYYEALLEDSKRNIDEAWQYYNEAKKKADTEKEREKKGEVMRKSVSGPSLSSRMKKQERNLMTAYNDWHSGVAIFNEYLNERISVDEPVKGASEVYRLYVKLDNKLPSYENKYKKAGSYEKVDEVLKEYEETLFKKLEAHQMLAEERGLYPVKDIPEDFQITLAFKKEEKKEIEKKSEAEEKGKEKPLEVGEKDRPLEEVVEKTEEERQPEKIEAQPEPEAETQEVLVKDKEPEDLKEEVEEVKDIGEVLSASAEGLKEKGSYTFALKGSGAEELVGVIIPRFKEVWEEKGIKIVDFSIDADIKPDAGKIGIDVKVKKYIFSKRIQATLKLESKDGVLNTTQVSANPKIIDIVITSYNVQEMIEENIGGEKIHSIINKWLASEMETRGAKLEKVDFNFTPQDTLQVNVVGGTK